MSFVLLMLGIFFLGVLLAVIGGLLLFLVKRKLAGSIVLATGCLTILVSIVAFLSLVITSSTMG